MSDSVKILVSVVVLVGFAAVAAFIADADIADRDDGLSSEDALSEAVAANDPHMCDLIDGNQVSADAYDAVVVSEEDAQAHCRVRYAVETQDVAYCRTLPPLDARGPGSRGTCLSRLAADLQRPELCQERAAIDSTLQTDRRMRTCLTDAGANERSADDAVAEAVDTGDPSACYLINDDLLEADGLDGVPMSASHAQARCRLEVALSTQDVAYCRTLPSDNDWNAQGTCLRRVAEALQRPDLCRESADLYDPRWADDRLEACLSSVAS